MSADATPIRSPGRPAKPISSANSVRSAKPALSEIPKPRLKTPKPQPKNGATAFDPEAFLAKAGVGKQVLTLKKNETAYFQRKAVGEDSVVARPVRQGKQARDGGSKDQPGNPGGDDWHNQVPRQLLYESLQKAGIHRI